MRKIVLLVGVLYIVLQFVAVSVFFSMLEIAAAGGLPVDDLADMQMKIMNVVYYGLIAVGVCFTALLIASIIKLFRQDESNAISQ